MSRIRCLVVVSLGLAISLAQVRAAHAQCLVNVSTGYDQAAEAVLTEGDLDDDYTVDDGAGGGLAAAFTGGSGQGFPVAAWLANDGASLWISPAADSIAAPGSYTYEIRFQMPEGVSVGLVALVGRLSGDDGVTDIVVNGTSTGTSSGGFNAWTEIPPGTGQGAFQEGENVLQFVVNNSGDAANPAGLRVDACVAIATPEIRAYDISTGFDRDAGSILPNGADDAVYTLTGPDGSGIGPGPAVVINDNAFPIPPWLASSVQSKWIGPAADSNGPPGDYNYKIEIELPPEVDAQFASIGGGFAADDSVVDVLVNGTSTGMTAAGFGALTPFPAAAGRGLFVTGMNTIEFLLQNGGEADGPTGLRVDGEVLTCPVPAEPPALSPTSFVIDTGFDQAAGALIANGQPDDNYELVLPPGSEICRQAAIVINDDAFPIPPWIGTSAQSKWIGPAADSNGAVGPFLYRLRVEIPEGIDAAALRLVGGWSSDNNGLAVLVNGVATGATTDGNFAALHPFPADAGLGLFQTGENLVEFLVDNAPPGSGPTGLRVEGVIGQGTPPGDLSTGMGARGIGPVGEGFPEGRYAVTDPDSNPAEVTVLAPEDGWLANEPGSKWIGPVSAAVPLTYSISFDLGGGVNPNRVVLEGGWTSDPANAAVLLNGVILDLASPSPDALTAFPEGTGKGLFVPGTNTLTFVVDAPGLGQPTGLRVDAGWQTVVEANPLDISTGFDEAAGAVLNPGDADAQYTLVLPDLTEVASTVITGAPIPPWAANTATSAWVGNDTAGSNGDPGAYSFRTTVNLTAGEAAGAFLSGGFTGDDSVADVLINDQSTALASTTGFGALTMFPAEFGLGLFQEGENTISFLVNNGGADANPFGLRVDAVVDLVPPTGGSQMPGDCNQDAKLDLSDGICLLGHLFLGDPVELPCEGGTITDEGNILLLDGNNDGKIDLSDAVGVFGYLFLGTAPPVLGTECTEIPGCPDACQ